MMRCVPRRWMLMAWLLCSLPAAFSQQLSPSQTPQVTEVALSVIEAPEPISWTPAPAGPGEFFYHRTDPLRGGAGGRVPDPGYPARPVLHAGGWERVPAAGAVRPADLAGRAVRGQALGAMYRRGLFALDPRTLAVTEEYPEVTGQCLAVTPAGFWCLDTFELARGIGTRGGNSAPAAYGLILYDRRGKEVRRLNADGAAFPRARSTGPARTATSSGSSRAPARG